MGYDIHYICLSHPGRVREMNEDSFICLGRFPEPGAAAEMTPLTGIVRSGETSLFGVFDGMGGEACGEIASYIAASHMSLCRFPEYGDEALVRACHDANDKLVAYMRENGIRAMGTTTAMVLFRQSGVTLCNLGDSRVYRFSDGTLELLSQDHTTPVGRGRKPALTQNLGTLPGERPIRPYLSECGYTPGARFLITTDGLTDMIGDDEIASVLASEPSLKSAGILAAEALEAGGTDNITLILCQLVENHRSRVSEAIPFAQRPWG